MSAPQGTPSSPALTSTWSSGILPRCVTLNSLHIFCTPPLVGKNICVSVLHDGQTNPLMFSMTPLTGMLSFWQKLSSLRTSERATSCGVETMMAYKSHLCSLSC